MRKEQMLLLVAVAIGGLLIWYATGKYTEVGAAPLPPGKDVSVIAAEQPDPTKGLSRDSLKGRAIWAQLRPEKRAPLPELPVPAPLAPWFVKLMTTPGVSPDHWRLFRIAIVPATAKADPNAVDPNASTPDQPPDDPKVPGKKKFDPAKAAHVVRPGSDDIIAKLEPSGQWKGQPEWVILDNWPNVSFFVVTLNPTTGTMVGKYEVVGPDGLQNFTTVHLSKSLLNEFHEERITRHVKDSDRDGLVKLAQWTFETLPSRSGEDEIKYGRNAVKKAIETLNKAKAISNDIALTRQLGEYYRADYDFDGELKVYLEFLNDKHTNDSAAQILVGDAYERLGALEAAKSLYSKAVQAGDPVARLKIGLIAEREGDLEAATASLKQVANAGTVSGRALTALARIALARGNVAEAASLAEQAKKEGVTGDLNKVLGGIQYAQGKANDAANLFAAAKEDENHSEWLSNRGMALVAADKPDDAKKDFYECLEKDPLNLVAPLFGLADVFQRAGLTDRCYGMLEVALARSPDDPWGLLRLGTIRLKDAQPDKALLMGEHLLDVAPGCVEGLWLVGRAYAALPTPDYEKAAAYLRRAAEKEPDNRDFINEYARVLIAGSHTDEALKTLETATNVTSGVGRTDPKLLALLAWARFLAKRPIADVFEAIERGKRAQPDDSTKEWLNTARKIMDDWDHTRIFADAFDRSPTAVVGNGWTEMDQANGISISIGQGGLLVFGSSAAKQAAPTRDSATRIRRQEDLGRFKSVEISMKASPSVEMLAHIFAGPLAERDAGSGRKGGAGGAELGLGCDRTGNMIVWAPGGKGNLAKEYVVKDAAGNPRPYPMDDFHTIVITRKDDAKGYYEITFDGEKIAGENGKTTFEVGALTGATGKQFEIGFLVDADSGAAVEASVDRVSVTKTNK